MYGLPNGETELKKEPIKNLIYLGNSMQFQPGETLDSVTDLVTYQKAKWGNPFYNQYFNDIKTVLISSHQPSYWFSKKTQPIGTEAIQKVIDPLYYECRYNPCKDDGIGNEVYWVNNFSAEDGWDTKKDPDLSIDGFPLWIALWGWYDWYQKT